MNLIMMHIMSIMAVLAEVISVADLFPDHSLVIGGDFNVDFNRHKLHSQLLIDACTDNNLRIASLFSYCLASASSHLPRPLPYLASASSILPQPRSRENCLTYITANHHLYADDTQLLLSFSALDFSHNITYLENTITNVANWMSSNFLFLNPSKTEFLVFGLPQQLSKLNNHTFHLPNNVILSPVASNLGVMLDKKSVICTTYLFYF